MIAEGFSIGWWWRGRSLPNGIWGGWADWFPTVIEVAVGSGALRAKVAPPCIEDGADGHLPCGVGCCRWLLYIEGEQGLVLVAARAADRLVGVMCCGAALASYVQGCYTWLGIAGLLDCYSLLLWCCHWGWAFLVEWPTLRGV